MNDPVSYPPTTAAKPPPPRPGDPADLACDVVQAACTLLRGLPARGTFRPSHPLVPLADWLERGCGTGDEPGYRARCRRLAAAMVEQLNDRRRAAWLEYLGTRQEPWGRWVDREVSRTYEVDPSCLEGDGLLRTAAPLRLGNLLDLHRKYLHANQPDPRLLLSLAAVISSATAALLDEAQQKGEPVSEEVRHAHARLSKLQAGAAPASPGRLGECLAVLLRPREPLWGWGCLTSDCQVRLFQSLPQITGPYLTPTDFEQLRNVVEELRDWIDSPAGKSVDWLLERLHLLGEAAARLGPVLAAGPGRREHRLWVACLLENFERLARLARYARPDLDSSAAPEPRPEEADTALDQDQPGPHPPGRTAGSPDEDTEILPGPRAAEPPAAADAGPPADVKETGAAPTPPPSVPKPPATAPAEDGRPAPDARLGELVAAYPEHVGSLEEVGRLAVEARDTCAKCGWKQAVDALEGLRAKCQQHREWLLNKTAGVLPTARDGMVKQRTVALTDELLNNLKQLDRLLPGVGEEGPLPPLGPAHLDETRRRELCRRVTLVRKGLFDFMTKHGGYRLYEVEIGDNTVKHNGRLNNPPPREVAARRAPQHTVAQILQPGYVVERAGKRDVKEYPWVLLAK